jgi:hypothetical protein
MIRWLIYIVFVLYLTGCKSVKKSIVSSNYQESVDSMIVGSALEQKVEQEQFIEEVEEQIVETYTSIQTDSGLVAVPVKTTTIKRRTQSDKQKSESDSQNVSQEFVLFKAEADLDKDIELEETQIVKQVTEPLFGGNLKRILMIVVTIGGAVATWYMNRKKAKDDSGL